MKKTPITHEPLSRTKETAPRPGLRLVHSAEPDTPDAQKCARAASSEAARPTAGRTLVAFMTAYADAIDRDVRLLLEL